MRKITSQAHRAAAHYRAAEGKPFGNLHERMKLVLDLAGEAVLYRGHPALWQALHDLATEVSYHEPAEPPYGRRPIRKKARL